MASFETLQQLAAHPEWIAPRSDIRVFLGEPGAPEATKTTVEPGNAFSPGMMSFGVNWWLRFPASGHFFAPEEAPLETLQWRYEEGYLPAIVCSTKSHEIDVEHTLFQDGTATDRDEAACALLELTNSGAATLDIQIWVVLRSLGPAGGPLHHLEVDGQRIEDQHHTLMALDRTPSAAGCGVGDPSALVREGEIPDRRDAQDEAGWCYAVARYDVTLRPGQTWAVAMDCPIVSRGSLNRDLPGTASPQPESFTSRLDEHLATWRERYGSISLEVPDRRFFDAFFAGLGHMMTAVVGDQARIATLSYPLPWLRDSIYIIRCFDLAGQHQLARSATEYAARNDFFGGFGAEGDAPGQGIWAVVQHYRLTRDLPWLREAYPAVRRKAEWLYRMRRATEPITVTTDTPVLAFTHAARNAGVICVAAENGIIRGVMDHGVDYSVGWINQWALCGLGQAALAAEALDREADATAFRKEAAELRDALRTYASEHPEYFHFERTMNSLLWPTHTWDRHEIEARFDAFWRAKREVDGQYQPEPYWLYFEFAQAHNALLLGHRERAWQVLNYRLAHQDVPGLYGFREGGNGVGTENAIHGGTLIPQLRGCQTFDSITPHGWSQAELWLLQRAMMVTEEETRLRLFSGVPETWLQPGQRVAFERFPTLHGRVDASVYVDCAARYRVAVAGVHAGTEIVIDLPRQAHRTISHGTPIELVVDRNDTE
jgi:hypothetical protein